MLKNLRVHQCTARDFRVCKLHRKVLDAQGNITTGAVQSLAYPQYENKFDQYQDK